MRKKYNKSISIYALIIFVYAVFQTNLSFADRGESMFKALQLPDTQSCSINRDLLSDEATYSKTDITGALPYIRSYETTLSNNQNRVNDMTAGLKSIGGWTDNYNNYALVEDAGNGRDTRIRVRLPGDKDDTYYIYAAGANTIQRIFSPTPMIFEAVYIKYSNGNYKGADPIGYISQDHRDRPLILTAGGSDPTELGFYVKTKGVTYQFQYVGNQINSPATKVYKIIRIIYPDRTQLGLSYENYGGKGLLSVADNRGHILTFDRSLKFDGNEARSVVDSVTLKLYEGSATSEAFNTAAGIQTATYTYQRYDWTNFQTNSNDGFYTLTQATTNLYGTETYAYNQKAALVTANDKRGNHFQAQHQIPVLTDVIDAAGKTQFHWSYHADYYRAGWTALDTTYRPLGGEQVQSVWRGQSHGGSSKEGKNWVTYYDYSVNIKGSDQLSTGTISASGDVRNPLITYTFSGFPCVTYKNIPVQKQIMDVRQNHVTDIYDMQGNHYHFEYDGLNRIIKHAEAMGTPLERTTSYAYTTFIENGDKPNDSLTPNTVTGPNLSVINNINMFGQIERQTRTSPQSGSSTRTVNYEYYEDSTQPNYGLLKVAYGLRDGQQVGSITQFPDKTEYTYDVWGNIATTKSFISNMHSGVTTARLTQYFDYNSAGLPARKTDPDSKTTFYTYNAAFLVTNENYANLAGTSKAYNDLRQLTSSTDADGKTTSYSYDDLGRVTRVTKPAGNYISYEYYSNGIVKHEQQHNPDGYVFEQSNQEIDGNGRIAKSWKGGNSSWNVISYSYDNNGNVTSQTDANGIVERWSYDAFNRVTSHTNGNGKVDSKGYDSSDNVTTITDPNNNTAQHDYKNTNTLMHDINSELPMKRYWHDDSENNTKYQFGSRSCWYNQHDQLGRMRYSECIDETNDNADLKAKTFYGWDDLNDRILNVVDETQGSFSDKGVNTYYEYDVLGRISKKRQMNKTPKQWGYPTTEQHVSYNYTTAGRIQGMTYPSGNRIEYGYSPEGRLDNISFNDSSLLCNVNWDGADRLRGWAWGCQDQHRYYVDIDDAGYIFEVRNKINGTDQFVENYYRERNGRINRKVIDGSHTKGYQYDNAGQLTSECHGQAANGTCYMGMTYTYDNNGNRLTKTFNTNSPAIALPANESYGYWHNVLTSWAVAGNALNIAITDYKELIDSRIGAPYYDFAGRRKLEGGVPGSTKYTSIWNEYNHKNERTFRGGSYLDRQYVYDEDSHLIGEYKPDGSLIVEYIWMGDKPVAAIYPNNKVYWIVTDHQNTPRRLIDRDNQSTVWTWDSDAFGVSQPVGSVEMNLRFPGQYYDEQSGLFYNHNRYYNPKLGRYMEPDPIGLEGGLNPYAYAGNNPVNNVDPSGLDWMSMDDGAMSGVMGDYGFDLLSSQINYLNLIPLSDNQLRNVSGGIAPVFYFIGTGASILLTADGLAGGEPPQARAAKAANAATSIYSGILRQAASSKGNYGLGLATAKEADELGQAWVGSGYKIASDNKTLISSDKLRTYRPPTVKNSSYATTGIQANFERLEIVPVRDRFGNVVSEKRVIIGNGHLNIRK